MEEAVAVGERLRLVSAETPELLMGGGENGDDSLAFGSSVETEMGDVDIGGVDDAGVDFVGEDTDFEKTEVRVRVDEESAIGGELRRDVVAEARAIPTGLGVEMEVDTVAIGGFEAVVEEELEATTGGAGGVEDEILVAVSGGIGRVTIVDSDMGGGEPDARHVDGHAGFDRHLTEEGIVEINFDEELVGILDSGKQEPKETLRGVGTLDGVLAVVGEGEGFQFFLAHEAELEGNGRITGKGCGGARGGGWSRGG